MVPQDAAGTESAYQQSCFMLNGNFRRRKQSTEINVATRALSTIVTYFGLGAGPRPRTAAHGEADGRGAEAAGLRRASRPDPAGLFSMVNK